MALAGPEIEIDGIVFRLIARDSFDTYKVVGYLSGPRGVALTNPLTQGYAAYKSNSEGFWRLALRTGPGYGFEKGKNYITTTFLHLRLQAFIEEHYDTLRPPPRPGMYMQGYNAGRGKALMNAVLAANRKNVPDDNREFFDPVFDLINRSCTSYVGKNCVARPTSFVSFMNPPRALPPPPRESSAAPRTPSPPVEGGPVLSWLTRALPPNVQRRKNAANARRTELQRDLIVQYRRLYEEAGSPEYITSSKMLQIMSRFVEQNFEVDLGQQNHVFDMPYFMEAGEKGAGKTEERFIMHIFQTRIRNRVTGQEYNLYYSQFTRKGKHYKNIVNIVPVEATILENGLYSKYISAIPYIYKIFDYSEQCFGLETNANECERYIFIAPVFINLWPLPLLTTRAGGRRKTRSRKYSQKKLRLSRRNNK